MTSLSMFEPTRMRTIIGSALVLAVVACSADPAGPDAQATVVHIPPATPSPTGPSSPTTPSSPTVSGLAMSAGAPNAGTDDDRIALPLTVRAFRGQEPAAGITVRFSVRSGSGAVNPTEVVTDAAGEAQTTLTYPYDEQNVVQATSGELVRTEFSVGSYRNHEGAIRSVSGYFLEGIRGQPLDAALTVRVVARDGKTPLASRVVQFTIDMGGGSLSASTATTDATGQASVRWTLGSSATVNRVQVSGDRLIPFTIHATGR